MKRTLKRELKAPEMVRGEAHGVKFNADRESGRRAGGLLRGPPLPQVGPSRSDGGYAVPIGFVKGRGSHARAARLPSRGNGRPFGGIGLLWHIDASAPALGTDRVRKRNPDSRKGVRRPRRRSRPTTPAGQPCPDSNLPRTTRLETRTEELYRAATPEGPQGPEAQRKR